MILREAVRVIKSESFPASRKKLWVQFPDFIVHVMSHGTDLLVSTLADFLLQVEAANSKKSGEPELSVLGVVKVSFTL